MVTCKASGSYELFAPLSLNFLLGSEIRLLSWTRLIAIFYSWAMWSWTLWSYIYRLHLPAIISSCCAASDMLGADPDYDSGKGWDESQGWHQAPLRLLCRW